MSYILNALRKAENKGLTEDNLKRKKQILVLKRRNRGGKLKILILVTVLLAVLFSGWLLGQWQKPQNEIEFIAATPKPGDDQNNLASVSQKAVVDDNILNAVSSTNMAMSSRNGLFAQTAVKKTDVYETNPPIPFRAAPPVEKHQPQVEIQQVSPALTEGKALAGGNREESLPNYSELPQVVKQQLPALKISLHFYNSSPSRRLVRINDKILHENERINDDLTVEEITSSSAVLNYDGYLFELDAPGG